MSDEKKPINEDTAQFDRKQLDEAAAKASDRIDAYSRDRQAMTPPAKPQRPKEERIVVDVPPRPANPITMDTEEQPTGSNATSPTATAAPAKPGESKDPAKKPEQPISKLPRWARITLTVVKYMIVPVMSLVALFAGVYIGYVQIGGQEASDVWKLDTWKHLIDLIFKD